LRVAISHDHVFDLWQGAGAGERGMGIKEGLVIELENGQINAWRYRLNTGRKLVARLVGLDLDLAGV